MRPGRRRGAGGRRLVLHVGTRKTGSTSIQYMLGAMAPWLARRGIRVASSGRLRRGAGNHGNLAYERPRDPAYRPALGGWADLRAEILGSAASVFVVSSELLTADGRARGGAGAAAALAEATGLEVDIVGYVRPQWQRVESGWTQQAKYGMRETLDEFVEAALDGTGVVLDYNAVFAPWREAFGDRVRVFPLEPSRLGRGLLAHFLGVLGVSDVDPRLLARLPRANVRPGAKELEARRLAAAAMRGLDAAERRRRLYGLSMMSALFDDDTPFAGLGADRARAVMARYEAANARFAREYGIDADGVLFRDPVFDGCGGAMACWDDFGEGERRRVRRYVLDAAGVDIAAAVEGRAPPPAGAFATWARIVRALGREAWAAATGGWYVVRGSAARLDRVVNALRVLR